MFIGSYLTAKPSAIFKWRVDWWIRHIKGSNEPTFDLIVDLIVFQELKESGELEQMLPKRQQLEDRLDVKA